MTVLWRTSHRAISRRPSFCATDLLLSARDSTCSSACDDAYSKTVLATRTTKGLGQQWARWPTVIPTRRGRSLNTNPTKSGFRNHPGVRDRLAGVARWMSLFCGPCTRAGRFARLQQYAILVTVCACSGCGSSGTTSSAPNTTPSDVQLAGDVTGVSSNNQVNGTHLSSPLPVSQGGSGASSAAADTVFAGPTSGAAAAPGFRSLTLSDLPTLSPGYILGNANASAMAPSEVMGSCTPALMTTTNTAAQNVAAYTAAVSIALKATFGNVCLPPGKLPFATVKLTQAFSGVHTIGTPPIQTFSTNQPALAYTLTGGTILEGSGTGSGPAFTFVGPGGAPASWANGFLANISFENIGFDNWDREFLFGGTNLQGVSFSKFNNLYGTNIGVRAYDFINSTSLWIDNLIGYFSGSGFRMADDLDNAVYGSTTNSYIGTLNFTLNSFTAEGIVLEATAIGTGGSQLNEILGAYWFVERPTITPKTQSVTMSNGSAAIGVSNNTYLPTGMPVGFTTSVNGFVSGETYFVISSSNNSIQVSKTYGGPPFTASGNSAVMIKSVGAENIAIRALGVEYLQNAGVVSNVHVMQTDSEEAAGNAIFLQGVSGGEIMLGDCPPNANVIAGVALRDVNAVTITNAGTCIPTRDNDGYGNQDNYWNGSYSGPDVQPYGFLGQGLDVNGDYYRTALAPTDAGTASPGLSVRGTGGDFLYSDFGIGQPYNINGAADPTLNAGESGIFAYAGAGGTCTLPAISNNSFGTSLVGLPYWFTNVGSGPCTLTTQGGQTLSGISGVTSMTVPVGGTVALSAEPLGSGFTWHVLSYVQPSQVQFGSLSLPTTTVASLPTCGIAEKGLLYSVSDALSPTYNGPLKAGGSTLIPVFCNGSVWTAH